MRELFAADMLAALDEAGCLTVEMDDAWEREKALGEIMGVGFANFGDAMRIAAVVARGSMIQVDHRISETDAQQRRRETMAAKSILAPVCTGWRRFQRAQASMDLTPPPRARNRANPPPIPGR